MLRYANVALALLAAGCGHMAAEGKMESSVTGPELPHGAEKLSIAATASVRTAAPYTGTVYTMCSASCRYKVGDENVVAGAGDTAMTAGFAEKLSLDGEYVAFYSPAGTVQARIADWYVDKISWGILFPISSHVSYTGIVHVVCNRRAEFHNNAVVSDGMTTSSTGTHFIRLDNDAISVVSGASNGACYITGLTDL